MTAVTHVADIPATDGERLEHEARRLLWQCRRGMKELDILLERFAREALPYASEEEWRAFAQLLALPDPALGGYLLAGAVPPEGPLARLVRRIRA